MRTLGAECGVIAVAGVHHRVVAESIEHPGADVVDQLVEIAGLPRLADAAGKQAIAGEQLRDSTGSGPVEGQRDRSWRMPAQMDDVEGQLADLDGVAAGQQAVRSYRQRFGVDLV